MLHQECASITLLVRAESAVQARERALSCLRQAARDRDQAFDEVRAASLIKVVVGDLTQPSCGIDPDQLAELQYTGAVEFWHVAATLRFEESKAERIHDQNVTGTLRALELAQALGATRFVYVSTAYVCGNSSGQISETLASKKGPFNNAYEHSKCLAEHLVQERCTATGLDFCILRPSIVVGLSGSHLPSGSDSGLYGFVREASRLRRALIAADRPVRLLGDRDAPLNFVPVDVLVRDMLSLRNEGFVGGPVYHLTSEHCPTVGETMDAICDALDMPRFEIVPELIGDTTAVEGLLARRVVFYGSYLTRPKTFARAWGPRAAVDASEIEKYVARYLELKGTGPLEPRAIEARDGFPLLTASFNRAGRETVVLVNAMGMPREALAKLETALVARFNVLTWQSRGVPSLDGRLNSESARFSHHVDDLEDLLAAHGVEQAHVVGWCTGADVALEFANRSPKRVRSLVCLHGPFLGLSRARTSYQSSLERIVRYAAKSEGHAAVYHGLIGELLAAPSTPTIADSEAQASTRAALSVLDPELMHVTGASLRSVASFHRYCSLLEHYLDEAPAQSPFAKVRALVVSASDDAIAHADASRDAAALLGAEFALHAVGGHFAPCKSDALIQTVVSFIAKARPTKGVVARVGTRSVSSLLQSGATDA